MAENKLPPGHELVTLDHLEIVGGNAFGAGTYPVPASVKRELQNRGALRDNPAAPSVAPVPPPPPPPNTAAHSGADSGAKTAVSEQTVTTNIDQYWPLLKAAGVTNIQQLRGMNEEQLRARVPGLTPVGIATVKEHLDQLG